MPKDLINYGNEFVYDFVLYMVYMIMSYSTGQTSNKKKKINSLKYRKNTSKVS